MRYAVNLGDPLNQLVLDAATPLDAVREAQHLTGGLDRCPPGRQIFTVIPHARLVPECEAWADPCGEGCGCDTVLTGGPDVRVPVVLVRGEGGLVRVEPDEGCPAATQGQEVHLDQPQA